MPSPKEHLKRKLQIYAAANGFILNPDDAVSDRVLDGLLRKKEKHGELYCPCRILGKDAEFNRTIICPCSYHKDEIQKDGHCHCLLFYKKPS